MFEVCECSLGASLKKILFFQVLFIFLSFKGSITEPYGLENSWRGVLILPICGEFIQRLRYAGVRVKNF